MRCVFFFTFVDMEQVQQLINAGWDIGFFWQKKRVNGEFVTLLQYRAKKFGTLKEYRNDNNGYRGIDACIDDMINNLPL